MKKMIMMLIFILSFNTFAGSLENRRTGEKISVTCLEKIGERCDRYELFLELESGVETMYLEYTRDYYGDSGFLLEGTMNGALGPLFVLNWGGTTPLTILATIVITPVTIPLGIVSAPVKITKKIIEKRTSKKLKNLFRLDKEVNKKTNNKMFKRVLETLR